MSRWRILVVLILLVLPFATLAAFGSYFLWRLGWSLTVGWPLTASMILGYLLAWYWQRRHRLPVQPAKRGPNWPLGVAANSLLPKSASPAKRVFLVPPRRLDLPPRGAAPHIPTGFECCQCSPCHPVPRW